MADWSFAAAVLTVTLFVTPTNARGQASSTSASFDWFSYTGHDPIYEKTTRAKNEYVNPILAGFYPDPSIVRRGDDYYIVNSSFSYFPGVPIFHSKDLVHWTQIGSVLNRPSQLSIDTAGVSRGIFAPVIREHAGTFYVITTIADRGNFIVTAKDPAGPWSDPVWLPELNGKAGYDPSLFFDDNGRAYVVNDGPPNGKPLYDGHRAIWLQEFDLAKGKMVGPRTIIANGGVDIAKKPVSIEAPHIFKHDGKYFLICAEGGTGDQQSEVVFRSDSPRGPYVPGPVNPILTQRQLNPSRPFPITSAGHADFVETQTGEWWAVFHAVRPYRDNLYNTGRETFLLPVQWSNGWPLILAGNDLVPYIHRRPNLPADASRATPMSGNFTVRDDFNAGPLAPYWMSIRTPREAFYSFKSHPGSLTIKASHAQLGTHTAISFIGRRQQHINASVSTSVTYAPLRATDVAGLVVIQTDDFYYSLGLTLVNGVRSVRLEERDGRDKHGAVTLASAPLKGSPDAPVFLKIDAHGDKYDFSYGTTAGKWISLKAGADGTILSSKVAGGFSSNFVGAVFGMYASSPR